MLYHSLVVYLHALSAIWFMISSERNNFETIVLTLLTMPAGRPSKFETSDQLEAQIDNYFAIGVKIRKVVCGPPNKRYTEEVAVPTITGLALYLGFESRQSFYDYEKIPEFSYTIKKARLLIENEYEEQLQAGNTVGAIFALKNMGWKDKHEVEQSGGITVRQYTGIENVVDDGPNK